MFIEITHSVEPSIVGINNGVAQIELDNDSLSILRPIVIDSTVGDFLKNQYSLPNLNIGGLKGVLLNNAKLTDVMMFSPFMFGFQYIVSQKFVNCLKEANVPEEDYTLFPLEINEIDEKYFLFFVPMIPMETFNFSNSLIYPTSQKLDKEKTYFDVNTNEEFVNVIKVTPLFSFEKVSLPTKYNNKKIISLQGSTRMFISKDLIDVLSKNNVSNIVIPQNQTALTFDD